MKKTLCTLAVLASTLLPAMAAGVDVNVTGTVKPAACTLDLPAGATIDYGKISPTLLNGTDYTLLAEKQIDITLSCDAPAKIGLKALNGRIGTMAGVTESAGGIAVTPVNVFVLKDSSGVGLGLDGTRKIGGYGIRLTQGSVTVDGHPADVLSRGEGDATWGRTQTGTFYEAGVIRNITWGTVGTTVPMAFQNMAGKIGVQAYINKKSELDLSKPVLLDGLTTLEMVYL